MKNVKYVAYPDSSIYAIYYYSNNTIYYNVNFSGEAKIIVTM